MFKTRKIYYFLLSLFFIIIPGIVFASQVLNITWPPSPGTRINLDFGMPLHHIIAYFYEWGIALGGLVAFIALLMAGAKYLTSAGAPQKMKDAQDGITRALFGLGLLLSSFIILHTINPHLVHLEEPVLGFGKIGPGADIQEQPEFLRPCERVTIFSKQRFEGQEFTTLLNNCQPVGGKRENAYCFIYGDETFWDAQRRLPVVGRGGATGRIGGRYYIGWDDEIFFNGSIKWERRVRESYIYIYIDEEGKERREKREKIKIDEHGQEIWDTNCFCEINIYDNICGARQGGFLAVIDNRPTNLAMVALSIDPMERGIKIVSIRFLSFKLPQ